MTESLHRYRALLNELLFEREAAGGELSEHQESLFVEQLDHLWWQLSSAEQDLIDRELSQPSELEVREPPNLVDCAVSEGSSALRRSAFPTRIQAPSSRSPFQSHPPETACGVISTSSRPTSVDGLKFVSG
jgi:hypothetical protein